MLRIDVETIDKGFNKDWVKKKWHETPKVIRIWTRLDYEQTNKSKEIRKIRITFSVPDLERSARNGNASNLARQSAIETDFLTNFRREIREFDNTKIIDVDFINDPSIDLNKKPSKTQVKLFKRVFSKYLKTSKRKR